MWTWLRTWQWCPRAATSVVAVGHVDSRSDHRWTRESQQPVVIALLEMLVLLEFNDWGYTCRREVNESCRRVAVSCVLRLLFVVSRTALSNGGSSNRSSFRDTRFSSSSGSRDNAVSFLHICRRPVVSILRRLPERRRMNEDECEQHAGVVCVFQVLF